MDILVGNDGKHDLRIHWDWRILEAPPFGDKLIHTSKFQAENNRHFFFVGWIVPH